MSSLNLANFWEIHLQQHQMQDGFPSLGLVLLEMIEPGANMKLENTKLITNPGRWSSALQSFFNQISKSQVRDLLRVRAPVPLMAEAEP